MIWMVLIFSCIGFLCGYLLRAFPFITKRRSIISSLSDWDIQIMAFHEAGHAVVSLFLPERERLLRVTIDPSVDGFGYIRTGLRKKTNETYVSFLSNIAVMLAGRLSEEIFLQEMTTSAFHDLRNVKLMVTDMVTLFGMGKRTGMFQVGSLLSEQSDFLKEQIEKDQVDILKEAESRARMILKEQSLLVTRIAKCLIQQRTLNENDIMVILANNKTENIG